MEFERMVSELIKRKESKEQISITYIQRKYKVSFIHAEKLLESANHLYDLLQQCFTGTSWSENFMNAT
jgi:hypothetical protein